MLVLGIDTSDGVGVALVRDGDVLARAQGADPRRHAETLAPAVEQVLAEAGLRAADLDAVAVGTGPAPFTGLRVGLVTARTLARVLDRPAIGLCSLDVLARQTFDALAGTRVGQVLAVADARRREVYVGRYRRHPEHPEVDVARLAGPSVATPVVARADVDAALAAQLTDLEAASADGLLVVAGRGAELYADVLPPTAGAPRAVDAAVLARIAVHRAAHGGETGLEPRYLRRPDVTPAAGRKRAS